ncbi:type II toxin-antitoxin system HicB family antitoxin [Candidatus Micrarchaeota archaeon]|nr:type II toxin-antitoxin system HicB family antitoxin [Candidatus Micrarchaeota archaeon]
MVRKYALIVEKDSDGWLVSEVLGLPGCHSQAKTMDELIKRTKEAIHSYLKAECNN